MSDDHNIIQYVVPEVAELFFSILPHIRDIFVKLLRGTAEIHIKQRQVNLPLDQEFPIPIWECLLPYLKATTACDFLFHGSHNVFFVMRTELIERVLFRVFSSGNSFSFIVEKNIQIQIFPCHYTEKDSSITIRSTLGTPEVFGYKLSPKVTYSLSPYFPVLIKSAENESYSVYINGLNRRIRLSILDENYHTSTKAVKDHIFTHCLFAKKFKHNAPTVLVLGTQKVGKSAFCHLLVNEAFEKKMIPLYIDLDVSGNLSIRGSLSLTEIENRMTSTLDFKYSLQRLLHFGYDIFSRTNIRLYYHFIRKMGGLLSFHRKNPEKKNSLAIIDACGCLGDNNETIECILKSFAVDLVVVIGDRNYYENLKHSVLRTVASEFILKPQNIEEQGEYFEERYWIYKIQKYFHGSIEKPLVQHVRIVKFESMSLYEISAPGNDNNAKNDKMIDYKIEPVECSPNVVGYMLAVSAAKKVELLAVTEIKYYVCFRAVDMSTKAATVLVPESAIFYGGILIIGYVKMPETIALEQ